MNILHALLPLLLLLSASGAAVKPKPPAPANTVVLTALDVRTAVDIEAAFHAATGWGAHPGVVILDGSKGAFVYEKAEGNDYAINIFYSDLTLRGINNAEIDGGDGIFFDGVTADRVEIRNLTLHCDADCIISWGPHYGVLIRQNRLFANGYGIQIAQTSGWRLSKNVIQAGGTALDLIDASKIKVSNNRMSGFSAVTISNSSDCQVSNNMLAGQSQGVLLGNESHRNIINANAISGVEQAGIVLEPGVYSNRIVANRVTCKEGSACLTIDADPATWKANIIKNNKP